jgi:hypothetical protein
VLSLRVKVHQRSNPRRVKRMIEHGLLRGQTARNDGVD